MIITPPSNVSLYDGESLVLSCVATGYPPPIIQWAYVNTTNILASGAISEDIEVTQTKSNITIYKPGVYYCIASNEHYPTVYGSVSVTMTTGISQNQW